MLKILKDNLIRCPKKCLYISEKDELSNVNAIIFHSNADNLDINDLPTIRYSNQKYIFFTQESPPKAAKNNFFQIWRYFPKMFFNLSMTYRHDSDIVASYDEFIQINSNISLTNENYSLKDIENAMARKSKAAVIFVGNCYSQSGREKIVRELSNLIMVDQFGYCSGRKCDKECENKIIGNYYFFLAFENNICIDYVTEKFWRLKKLIVPIVLRRSITSKIAPNNSFIAVDDFKSVAELANYLEYLMKNKTAYLEYFEWTKIYQKTTVPWTEVYCRLCERISSNNFTEKAYFDISQWFDSSGTCKLVILNWLTEFFILWKKISFVIFTVIILLIFVIFKILKSYFKRT